VRVRKLPRINGGSTVNALKVDKCLDALLCGSVGRLHCAGQTAMGLCRFLGLCGSVADRTVRVRRRWDFAVLSHCAGQSVADCTVRVSRRSHCAGQTAMGLCRFVALCGSVSRRSHCAGQTAMGLCRFVALCGSVSRRSHCAGQIFFAAPTISGSLRSPQRPAQRTPNPQTKSVYIRVI
jgi:hypothetical protein